MKKIAARIIFMPTCLSKRCRVDDAAFPERKGEPVMSVAVRLRDARDARHFSADTIGGNPTIVCISYPPLPA
jgi:hypothetical protein